MAEITESLIDVPEEESPPPPLSGITETSLTNKFLVRFRQFYTFFYTERWNVVSFIFTLISFSVSYIIFLNGTKGNFLIEIVVVFFSVCWTVIVHFGAPLAVTWFRNYWPHELMVAMTGGFLTNLLQVSNTVPKIIVSCTFWFGLLASNRATFGVNHSGLEEAFCLGLVNLIINELVSGDTNQAWVGSAFLAMMILLKIVNNVIRRFSIRSSIPP